MTEGSDEKALIDVLIEKRIFKFELKELLFEQTFHQRQIDDGMLLMIRQLPFEDKVIVYRVGDKLTDKLDVRMNDIPGKIMAVYDVCTLPELEMLFIINECLFDDYKKVKSNLSPSEYYKSKNKSYKKQRVFVRDYFDKMDAEEIKRLFKQYCEKRRKVHNKNQYSLLDLLK